MKRSVIKTREGLERFFEGFDSSLYSIDTETTSLRYKSQCLVGVSLCDGTNTCYLPLNSSNGDIILALKNKLCEDFGKNSIVIGHNIVFDMKVLSKHGLNFYNAEWFDTMVADHLINENRESHSLKYLSKELLGKDVVEWSEAVKESEESFYEYAMNDAEWTYELAMLHRGKLKDEGLDVLFRKIEMPFLRVIMEMEVNGFLVDKMGVEEVTVDLSEQLFTLEKDMLDILGEKYEFQYDLNGKLLLKSKVNFNSSQQVANILFERLGLEPIGKTKTGKFKTGKELINKLRGSHVFVDSLEKYKVCKKLLSSFFEPLPKFIDGDGRVRPSFMDTGTRTGRLSCNSPNLQQLPNNNELVNVNTRKVFVAPSGCKLVVCDYSGQELRVLAHISEDPTMIKSFRLDTDFHGETAKEFGVTRRVAKTINFGIAYGKGAYGFSKDFDISEEEAQKILDKYFGRFPKVKEAIGKCHSFLRKNGYVKCLSGRRRRFSHNEQGFYPNSAFRQAFNFLIQGFSADMIRIAGVKLLNLKNRHKNWGMKILACVHDEYVIEVREGYVDEALPKIKFCFESAVSLRVPVKAEINVGGNYAEAK